MGNQVARTAQRTTSNKVIPPKERNDRWLTPLPIIEALTTEIGFPRFDLDPCGAPGHDTAQRTFLLENGDDGLRDDWILPWSERPEAPLGSVTRTWMNPPYGREMRQWIDRFVWYYWAGYITGTMLIPANMGTKIWQDIVLPECSAVLYWRHRINFWSRDERIGKDTVSVQASAIVAFGQVDADALWTAVERDLLPGSVTDYTEVPR